jgi:hypothetical protein
MVRTRHALAWLLAALLAVAAGAALRASATDPTGPSAPGRPTAPLARTATASHPPTVASRPPTAASGGPAASPSAAGPDAASVRHLLTALDRARAAGYVDPTTADPDDWAARSCACRDEDVRRLRALARAGLALRAAAVHLVSVSVAVARAGPESVDAVVVDRLAAYVAVDRRGRTVHRWPATGPRRWRITLVLVSGRWRLGAVARAP